MAETEGSKAGGKPDFEYPPCIAEELEQLYDNLQTIYGEIKFELEDRGVTPAELGVNSSERKSGKERPLIDPEDLVLPPDLVRRVILDVTKEVSQVVAEDQHQQLQELAATIERNELDIAEMLERFFSENNQTEEVNLTPGKTSINFELFFQVMLFTLRPFLSWLRQKAAGEDQQSHNWRQHNCPVCGALPELSRITHEEGKRLLFCWLCGNEWRFERFICLYCGENQADSQKYFVVKDLPYRVDICQDCERYLKVIDERRLPEMKTGKLSWLINDLGTNHLDSLAREEGYTRT